MAERRLRIKRGTEATSTEQLRLQMLTKLVDHRVGMALNAITERQAATESALHTIAIILNDIRNSAVIAATTGVSVTRKLDSFLRNLELAMDNRRILDQNLGDIEEWREALRASAITEDELRNMSDEMVELLSLETEDSESL